MGTIRLRAIRSTALLWIALVCIPGAGVAQSTDGYRTPLPPVAPSDPEECRIYSAAMDAIIAALGQQRREIYAQMNSAVKCTDISDLATLDYSDPECLGKTWCSERVPYYKQDSQVCRALNNAVETRRINTNDCFTKANAAVEQAQRQQAAAQASSPQAGQPQQTVGSDEARLASTILGKYSDPKALAKRYLLEKLSQSIGSSYLIGPAKVEKMGTVGSDVFKILSGDATLEERLRTAQEFAARFQAARGGQGNSLSAYMLGVSISLYRGEAMRAMGQLDQALNSFDQGAAVIYGASTAAALDRRYSRIEAMHESGVSASLTEQYLEDIMSELIDERRGTLDEARADYLKVVNLAAAARDAAEREQAAERQRAEQERRRIAERPTPQPQRAAPAVPQKPRISQAPAAAPSNADECRRLSADYDALVLRVLNPNNTEDIPRSHQRLSELSMKRYRLGCGSKY